MRDITGLIGRDALVEKAAQEVRKGRHVILTGKVGVGKSSVLNAILARLERRQSERAPVDVETDDPPREPNTEPNTGRPSQRQRRTRTVFTLPTTSPRRNSSASPVNCWKWACSIRWPWSYRSSIKTCHRSKSRGPKSGGRSRA
ncbi:MAG: ATP-binding protein [Candidatus Competibacter sp.]